MTTPAQDIANLQRDMAPHLPAGVLDALLSATENPLKSSIADL